jgi:GH15 family glucan-1,4-alpha-glucosidase
MEARPLEDHGVIGNRRTAALVGLDGSIDWLCLPRFDAPSVFGRLLGPGGGRFRIGPAVDQDVQASQHYWPETNVLVTRFRTDEGVGEVTDAMPLPRPGHADDGVVRIARAVSGRMTFRLDCAPAFDHGRVPHRTKLVAGGARFDSDKLDLVLATDVPLVAEGGAVGSTFQLTPGESAVFVLRGIQGQRGCAPLARREAEDLMLGTAGAWRDWLAGCRRPRRWRDVVDRSILTVGLLVDEIDGGLLAAPTRGLPADADGTPGGDGRHVWLRDAATTARGLRSVGLGRESERFAGWLEQRCRRPVADERLPDVLDALWLSHCSASALPIDLCRELRDQVDAIGERTRRDRSDCVHAQVRRWLLLDRAIHLLDRVEWQAETDRWRAERDEAFERVMEGGWSWRRHSFVTRFGGDTVATWAVSLPTLGFLSPTDERMLGTLDAIDRTPELERSNAHDFWRIEAMARAGALHPDRLMAARAAFERALRHASPLGLLGERVGPRGQTLGNAPASRSHLALLSAATTLDAVLDHR